MPRLTPRRAVFTLACLFLGLATTLWLAWFPEWSPLAVSSARVSSVGVEGRQIGGGEWTLWYQHSTAHDEYKVQRFDNAAVVAEVVSKSRANAKRWHPY